MGEFNYSMVRGTFSKFFTLYFRWQICNRERVPSSGPVILASNHVSFLDPPVIGSSLPRSMHFLARESLFRFPLIGAFIRSIYAIPVDREGGGGAGLKAIFDKLAAGDGVVLFPEGTRSLDGRIGTARSGIGLLVVKSGAPVVPVRIFGTYEAFGKHVRWPRPVKVIVKYGQPISFAPQIEEFKQSAKSRQKEIYQEIANAIMAAIAELKPYTDVSRFPR